MPAQKKLVSRLSPSEHAFLRRLDKVALVDFADFDVLIKKVVVDRFNLGRGLYGSAKQAPVVTESDQRRLISTCYYSQYHACRAVVLLHDFADNGNDHEKLPKNMERILPGRGLEGKLADMLSRRRCADYDPYLDFDPRAEATGALTATEQLLASLEAYLRSVGVTV